MFGSTITDNSLSLLKEFGLTEEHLTDSLKILAKTDSRYLRDLKINIQNALNTETLNKKEAFLLSYAVAANEKNNTLQKALFTLSAENGANEKELAEVLCCMSLLNANNIYYRFRHFMQDDFYNNAQAGIRMSVMANPVLGKEFFELTSLVISAVNGCELCVISHEKALVTQGTSKQRIHDAVKLAGVIKSLTVLM